jgi:Na+/H+-dicarboxylate symporter
MSEIRTVTNIIGNGCAAIFIAKIEGLLDIDDELKIGSSKSSTKKPAKKSAK